MEDRRKEEITHLLAPPAGDRLWYGGATVVGALRGVTAAQAAWRPAPGRHSIWELTLHVAYWKYAVRRILDDLPRGGFPRSPSNWPSHPDPVDDAGWRSDRALLKQEHDRLAAAIAGFDDGRLDVLAESSKSYRFVDLMFGVVTHDVYHVGQIQILKRLYRDNPEGSQR